MEKNQNEQSNPQPDSNNKSTREDDKKVTNPNIPKGDKSQNRGTQGNQQLIGSTSANDTTELDHEETAEETNDIDSIQNENKTGNQNSKRGNI